MIAHRRCLPRSFLPVLLCFSFAACFVVHVPTAHALSSLSTAATPGRPKAIVVGAGPVGVAAALTLSSAPHHYDVALLESAPEISSQYDPSKAFLYNVNLRGQALTSKFPGMQAKLAERGVPSGGFGGVDFMVVPADPGKPLPKKKDRVAGGANNSKEEGSSATDAKKKEEDEEAKPSYWIPRHAMVQLMLECVEEHNAECRSDAELGRIDYCPGTECQSIRPSSDDSCVVVATLDKSTGQTLKRHAALLVGADGANSRVRECLASDDAAAAFASWANCKPETFQLRKWTSPSSHQRIKVLQLPPRFQIPDGEGGTLTTKSDSIYAIRSIHTGPRNYLSLGLLPMKDDDAVRPTNIVTRPDHEIWNIRDGEGVRQWFEKAYPRMPFGKDGGMISDAEWDRFAKAEGTRFPYCQYSPGMGVSNDAGTCGIALVGDAIHAFPPDIGQGVNAGLADVVALDMALQGKDTVTGEDARDEDKRLTLKSNIDRYQKQHEAEIASLIRLARFGAPYQYKQPHRIDVIRRKIWTANVILRLLLNKLTLGLVPAQCIMLSQDPKLTFRQVMRRADLTALSFKAIALAVIGTLLRKRFGLSA